MELLPFSVDIIYYTVVLFILLFCSFIVSGSETALLSLSTSQIATITAQDSASSRAIKTLIDAPDRLISTILIINNLVNIAAILCANQIVDLTFYFSTPLLDSIVTVGVVTMVLIIFGEVMPKTLATLNNVGFSRAVAPSLIALNWLVWPLSWVLIRLGAKITPVMGSSYQSVSIEQLHTALEVTKSHTEEDSKILNGIVTFVGREVVEIMLPRVDIISLEEGMTFEEVIEVIKSTNHSRIPVCGENIDDVKGILFVKDLLPYIGSSSGDFDWHKLIREPYFIPENKKINDLLGDFQSKRRHQAIVVDEYGGTLGLVTLEDILEEIVGEISDETDTATDFYRQLTPTTYIFEGSTHLTALSQVLSIPVDILDKYKGDSDTLAGLMMEQRGKFFAEGEELIFENLTLRVEKVDGYRITKVFVKKNEL